MDASPPQELITAPGGAERASPTRTPALPTRTVADLIGEVILRGRSERTMVAYRVDLRDFLLWLLGREVAIPPDLAQLPSTAPEALALNATMASLQQVSEGTINRYLTHLRAGLKPSTINRRLTPLRLLFQRLHRYHLIAINPLEFVKSAKVSAVSETVYLSRADARRIEDACAGETLRDLRDRALLVFMLGTGVRSAEALGLQVTDLSTVDGHAVAWVQGKGGARERIKLAPRVHKQLRTYLDTAEIADGAVFRRVRRVRREPTLARSPLIYQAYEPLSYAGLKFILRSRFEAAELAEQLSPHSLRHSFITLAIRGGATLAQVQAAARHADPRTTMRYVHGMDDLDNNAVDYVNW
jgi:site-specific recombinase XerD